MPIITNDSTFIARMKALSKKGVRVEIVLRDKDPNGFTGNIKRCGEDFIELEQQTVTNIPLPDKDEDGKIKTETKCYKVTTIVMFSDIIAYSLIEDITNV